jgi:hypothetical protein
MKRTRDVSSEEEEDVSQDNDKKKIQKLESSQVKDTEQLTKASDEDIVVDEEDEDDAEDYDSEEDEDFNEDDAEDSEDDDDDDDDDDDEDDSEMAELVEENEAFFQECVRNRKSEGEINVMLGLDQDGADREKELAEEFLRKQRQDEEDDSNDDEDYLDDEDEDDEDDKNEEDYVDYKAIDVEDYVSEEDEDFDSDEEQNNNKSDEDDDDEEVDEYDNDQSFLLPETEEDRSKEVLEEIANIKNTFASEYNQKNGHFPRGKQLDTEWMDEMGIQEDKEITSRAIRSIIRELHNTGRRKSFHWEEDLVEKLGFDPGNR